MSESQGSVEPKKISRRLLLKGAAAAVLPVGAVKHEYDSIEQGITTETGVFFPVLESHRTGIQAGDLPDNLQYFFREIQPLYDLPAESILNSGSVYGPPLFETEVLEKLRKDDAKVVLGDVRVTYETMTNETLTIMAEATTGLFALTSAGVIKAVEMLKDKAHQEIPRKTLLNGIKKAVGAYGLWATTPTIATVMEIPTISSYDQRDVIDKIAASVKSINSQLHPEFPVTFFRNLVIAEKLLYLAEMHKTEYGEKPRIAFNAGSAHAGINNYLRAGRDVVNFLISSYDRSWVNSMIEANEGVENASTIRVVGLGNPSGSSVDISETRLTDQRLAATFNGMVSNPILKMQN